MTAKLYRTSNQAAERTVVFLRLTLGLLLLYSSATVPVRLLIIAGVLLIWLGFYCCAEVVFRRSVAGGISSQTSGSREILQQS